MKRLLTAIIASLMALTAMFSFTACGDNNETDNTIKVGMECGYAPFNYTQTTDANGAVKISNAEGYANGYDVQIAVKIAEALGKELAPSNIQVNAIACGVIDTQMNACFNEEERNTLAEEIPTGRFGRTEEVASLALQLCTGNEYLTSQIITLDGGWT